MPQVYSSFQKKSMRFICAKAACRPPSATAPGKPTSKPVSQPTDAQVNAGALALWAHTQGCTTDEAEERWNSVLEDFRNVYRRIARLVIEAALDKPGNQTGD